MSQVNARQKLRRLIRMAFAAKPTQTWLAAALMLGVSTNALFAQVPTTFPSGAQQSISDRGAVNAPAAAPQGGSTTSAAAATPVSPEVVMKWLNTTADAANKQDIKTACDAFARALVSWPKMSAPNEQVNARFREVEKVLQAQNVTKQQIQDSINALRADAPAPRVATAPAMPGNMPGTMPGAPAMPPVQPASANAPVMPATGQGPQLGNVQPGVFNPQNDSSRLQAAGAVSLQAGSVPANASADELYRLGMEALSKGNREKALEMFRRAWQYQGEMDPALRSALKDKLAALQASELKPGAEQVPAQDDATQEMRLLRSRLMSEITAEIAQAEAQRAEEPQMVAERLQALRGRVSQADLDGAARKQMLMIVDRAITSHQMFMTQNKAAIDQNMKNRQINEQVSLEQEQTYKVDQQIASLTETYNDLMDEGRYAEAEIVAKQVGVLAPNSQIATLLYQNARIHKRDSEYTKTRDLKADNFTDLMNAVDKSFLVPVEEQPMVFSDLKEWNSLTERRNRLSRAEQDGLSPAAAAIYEKLKQTVQIDFKNRPLAEVAKVLSDMTGIMIHVDPSGLASEGLQPDVPINLTTGSQLLTLRTALGLMLSQHNLSYRVQDEVLIITSARNTAEANYPRTYSVKDLVIPIPNFVADYNSGMGGALRAAYESLGAGLAAKAIPNPNMAHLASNNVDANGNVLGQVMPGGAGGLPGGVGGAGGMGGLFPWNNNGPVSGSNPGFMQAGNVPIQSGPAPAKYDELISLIQQTIDPDSWMSNGGSSTITPFAGNLSLVVSAPQTTHEKLADLLASLRRLQDLQVTIEVRFVTLNDNFFERMGVDFDFRIDDNNRGLPQEDQGRSVTVGMQQNFASTLVPTADLDLTFTQDNFTVTPPFGGPPTNAANFGFAILSDIEMFFFLTAAQGDTRTSVLQAPRVTMFDGQQANIQDVVARPFVVSLIPVVGDFAVGQQPVIVVINEGTTLNVQAVVSQDKRFVRLTLNPTFSRIDRVETFTFQGTTSTNSGTTVVDPNTGRPTTTDRDEQQTVVTGTTVQQPVLATTNVSTTVSVPDGGTILLGGIKRMSEGRTERGVPILSKIPYVNRLFKNTAIGRVTSTLMMTVTPRIIIQEEEEAILLGQAGGP